MKYSRKPRSTKRRYPSSSTMMRKRRRTVLAVPRANTVAAQQYNNTSIARTALRRLGRRASSRRILPQATQIPVPYRSYRGRRGGYKFYKAKRKTTCASVLNKCETRDMVNNMIHAHESVSTYRKTYLMDAKPYLTDANMQLIIIGGSIRGLVPGAPYTLKALSFTPCATDKIADAAAILYNGKTAALNYELEAGNFDIKKTVIDLIYASSKYSLRNNTDCDYIFDIYEVRNSVNQATFSFMQRLSQELNNSNITGVPALFATTNNDNEYSVTDGMKLTDNLIMQKEYSIKKLATKYVGVGKMLYFGRVRKQEQIKLGKYWQQGSSNLMYDYPKGDVQIVIRARPLIHSSVKVSVYPATTNMISIDTSKPVCFNIKVEEVYKIAQPANTPDAQEGTKVVVFNDQPVDGTAVQSEWVKPAPAYNVLGM